MSPWNAGYGIDSCMVLRKLPFPTYGVRQLIDNFRQEDEFAAGLSLAVHVLIHTQQAGHEVRPTDGE